jgi:hypothetical protein
MDNSAQADNLRREAVTFARYLIGVEAPPEVIHRYLDACRIKFGPETDDSPRRDDRAVRLAVRHRSLLPGLDAASALLRPKSLLREKLLLMAAILEATPEFAEKLLPERLPSVRLALRVISCGARTAFGLVIGIPLLMMVTREES